MNIHLTEPKAALMGFGGILGACVSELFGGWDTAIQTLFIFMALDYLSGLLVAGVFGQSDKTASGKLSSDAGFRGLLKKGMSLVIVLVAVQLDRVLGTSFIRNAVVIAYIVNETISIVENSGRMGLPVPDAIMKAIEQLQGKDKNQKGTSKDPSGVKENAEHE